MSGGGSEASFEEDLGDYSVELEVVFVSLRPAEWYFRTHSPGHRLTPQTGHPLLVVLGSPDLVVMFCCLHHRHHLAFFPGIFVE